MAEVLEIQITPPDLIRRMENYPEQLDKEMQKTQKQVAYHLLGSVPEYPTAAPESRYVRTGTLGRSIGLGAQPDIFEVNQLGKGSYEAVLGSRLHYAPYVIGAQSQTALHKGRGWWTTKTILEKAKPGVERLFEKMAQRLADWLVNR